MRVSHHLLHMLRAAQPYAFSHHYPPLSTFAFCSLILTGGLICFLDGFRKNPLSLDRCKRLLSWGAGYGMVWVQGAQRPHSVVGWGVVWHGTGSAATMQRSGFGEGTERRRRGLGEGMETRRRGFAGPVSIGRRGIGASMEWTRRWTRNRRWRSLGGGMQCENFSFPFLLPPFPPFTHLLFS
jgi:hypothetical protein